MKCYHATLCDLKINTKPHKTKTTMPTHRRSSGLGLPYSANYIQGKEGSKFTEF